MQLLNKETKKGTIATHIVNSEGSGSHVSIYVPIEFDSTVSSIKMLYAKLLSEAMGLLSKSEVQRTVDLYRKELDAAFGTYAKKTKISGIALFKSEGSLFHTALKVKPPELVVVASSFHIKPLLHCISSSKDAVALVVNARSIRLFHVKSGQVSLAKTYINHAQEQEHGNGSPYVGQRKRAKEESDRFVRSTAKMLLKDLDFRKSNLALLGPRGLRRKLRAEIAARSHVNIILDDVMNASIEDMGAQITMLTMTQSRESTQKFVKELVKSENHSLISNCLDEIGAAAVQGRIERLAIDPNSQVWGLFDRESGLVKTHNRQLSEKDNCVVDDITEEVLSKGGDVVFFDSSSLENVAPYLAILRW